MNLFRSRTRYEILSLFIKNPEGRYYLREIGRLTNLAVGALQRELKALEKESFLKSERVGPLKYFRLNQDHSCLPELQGLFLKEHRKKLLEKNLQRILKTLRERYHPEKVILYGSYALGKIHPYSDLDLLIVKKNVPTRYWDRIKELSPLLLDRDVGLDYTIWTPEELTQDKDNLFLQEEILKKGRVVYERRT